MKLETVDGYFFGFFALATPTLASFFSGMDDFTWEQQNYEQRGESDKEQKGQRRTERSLLPWFTRFFPFDFFTNGGSLNQTTVGVSRRLLVAKTNFGVVETENGFSDPLHLEVETGIRSHLGVCN